MPYCTRDDIENVFGRENVIKWADLDGAEDAAHVSTRVTWAITKADEEIDDRLRGTHYRVPLANSSGNTPEDVKDLSASLAGIRLHDSRGIEDDQAMTDIRAWVSNFFAEILGGKRKLDAVY